MTTSTVRVPAKINLSLGVGALGADGYHPVSTVFQAVDLCDEVRATARADERVSVHIVHEADPRGEHAAVPTDERNLAVQAALLLREQTGVAAGVDLAIRKVIPVAGGMAGGSADAAAALVACNAVWKTGLDRAELTELAAGLGSDVPFGLHGGIAVGTGRGDVLHPVLARGSYHWVVAIAADGLSTPAVYAEFDRLTSGQEIGTPGLPEDLLAALRTGDALQVGAALSNDLQDAALSLRPELVDTLQVGREAGAVGAVVSGSGPTTVFLARSEAEGLDIAFALAGSQVCADVVQARGPVPGARLVT